MLIGVIYPENNRLFRRNHKQLRTYTTASKDYERDTSSDNFANEDQSDIQPNEHEPNNTANDTNTTISAVSGANENTGVIVITRSGRCIKIFERLVKHEIFTNCRL